MAVKRRYGHIEKDIGHKLTSTQRIRMDWAVRMTSLENRVKHRTKNRLYKLANPERDTLYHKKRNAEIKYQLLQAYSKNGEPSCSCCKLTNTDFLTLDHTDNNGAEHRKTLKKERQSTNIYAEILREYKKTGLYPTGYKTMCMNCNWVKHLRGVCKPEYHTFAQIKQEVL